MKEQWKKLDSDAKLLVDVEEGRQLPIKINIPLTALTPARDEFCCNRFLTVLRVFVLLALLVLIGWTGLSLYSTYYVKTMPMEEQASLENSYAFQNLVYQKKDEVQTTEKSRDTEALDLIAAQMKVLDEMRDQLKVVQEQQRKSLKDDFKLVNDEVVASDRSDPTLDSMFDELAEKVGLADTKKSENVVVEYKPEVEAIVITEPVEEEIVKKQDEPAKEKDLEDIVNWFSQMASLDRKTSNNDALDSVIPSEPILLANVFPSDPVSREDAALDAIIRGAIVSENAENEEAQKEYFEMYDRFAANVNQFDSHEEEKQIEQVFNAMIQRIADSHLEDTNDGEQEKETEEKVEDEPVEEEEEEDIGDLGEQIVNGLIVEPLEILFGGAEEEPTEEEEEEPEVLYGGSISENAEESHVEEKVEREMMEQVNEDFEDDLITQFVQDALGDILALKIVEDEPEPEVDNEGSLSDLIDEVFGPDDSKDDGLQHELAAIVPSDIIEPARMHEIEKPVIDVVPSVEYVQKIQQNPFIPKVAKMLEPIVGKNHDLLVWYYTHKDLPNFLKGADEWKVFGAKLLYDSNIKDYPADATIVSVLAFEKVLDAAEYPASNEEIQSDLQQEIINRLILKSYLNKMLLEGNAEAETLSQVIEQHNEEKLKELDIDPQQLAYKGDFFEISNTDNDDMVIPVVQFDPFVDESREANEQRTQVIKAFGRTRTYDDVKASYERDSKVSTKLIETSEEPTVGPLELSSSAAPYIETTDDSGFGEEVTHTYTTLLPIEDELYGTTEVNMNDYLFSYDDPYAW